MSHPYLGDFAENATVYIPFSTHDATGANVAPSDAFELADIRIYKGESTTERSSTSGWTLTSPFDSLTGIHVLSIDLSDNTDAGFYAAGNDYFVLLAPDSETIDSRAIKVAIAQFSIENRFDEVDVVAISGDTTAADNLEAQFDGHGLLGDDYPASQGQVSKLAVGTAAISTTTLNSPDGYVHSQGTEVNNEDVTHEEDGVYHTILPASTNISGYYVFNIGGNGVPVSVNWTGVAQGQSDIIEISAYNFSTASWEQIGSVTGTGGSTVQNINFILTVGHVGTGANLGEVRWKFENIGSSSTFATDRIICSYSVVAKSVGYAEGAIWVDTNTSNTNTEPYVDGVADNPVSTWAAALTLNGVLGLGRFRVKSGSSITLSGSSVGYDIIGDGLFDINLNSQNITSVLITKASISGIGNGTDVVVEDCVLKNNISIPPGFYKSCGISATSGNPLTLSSAGEYAFIDCVSLVAGAAAPYVDFSGTGSTTGVNIRRWSGGINATLDPNVTMSHEVLTGGGATFTVGGGVLEIRGCTREITLGLGSGAGMVEFVGTTGPITITGTATTTVNLYGIAAYVNNTGTSNLNDYTITQTNIKTLAAHGGVYQFDEGSINNIMHIFIPDNTSLTGSGLTGLAHDSSGLTAYYIREDDASSAAISLVTATIGTYTSGGFKEVDSTYLPGVYEFGVPDALLSDGYARTQVVFKGAASMPDVCITLETIKPVYYADIGWNRDSDVDEFTVTWFKNSEQITSGITSPQIEVVRRDTGADLLAPTAMTQVGSTGTYKYDSSSEMSYGESYLVICTATIDGLTRTYTKVIGLHG